MTQTRAVTGGHCPRDGAEPGRGVALGPNKWGVSWVPGSIECGLVSAPRAPAPARVSVRRGCDPHQAEAHRRGRRQRDGDFRAMFMVPSPPSVIGSHGRPGTTSVVGKPPKHERMAASGNVHCTFLQSARSRNDLQSDAAEPPWRGYSPRGPRDWRRRRDLNPRWSFSSKPA